MKIEIDSRQASVCVYCVPMYDRERYTIPKKIKSMKCSEGERNFHVMSVVDHRVFEIRERLMKVISFKVL